VNSEKEREEIVLLVEGRVVRFCKGVDVHSGSIKAGNLLTTLNIILFSKTFPYLAYSYLIPAALLQLF
jgi:hypothetical protein